MISILFHIWLHLYTKAFTALKKDYVPSYWDYEDSANGSLLSLFIILYSSCMYLVLKHQKYIQRLCIIFIKYSYQNRYIYAPWICLKYFLVVWRVNEEKCNGMCIKIHLQGEKNRCLIMIHPRSELHI